MPKHQLDGLPTLMAMEREGCTSKMCLGCCEITRCLLCPPRPLPLPTTRPLPTSPPAHLAPPAHLVQAFATTRARTASFYTRAISKASQGWCR